MIHESIELLERLQDFRDNIEPLLKAPVLELPSEQPRSKRKLEPGDIIAAARKLPYQHFAVYIGSGRVVHFAAKDGDWAGTPVIHEAPFENFLRDSDGFEILDFSKTRMQPGRYRGRLPGTNTDMGLITLPSDNIIELLRNVQYHLYSPEETVERAKLVAAQCASEGSKIEAFLNGHKYNLLFNNCEHFAIWCKTGVHESRQVERILRLFGEAAWGV